MGRGYVLEVLKRLGGYYNCPKDPEGKRLGPLAGYAGTYSEDGTDEGKQLAYVGDLYANFAKAEEWPVVMHQFGKDLALPIRGYLGTKKFHFSIDKLVIAGPEKGGFSIAEHIAYHLDCRKAYVEKEITQLKSATAREQSKLVFKRHTIEKGDLVVISEDVSNNFSTTGKTIDLIHSLGAQVVAIATILNRSPLVEDEYEYNGKKYQVIALVRMNAPEFKQNDPYVAEDIKNGNVIWKPKDQWNQLPQEGKN
jgi:adenine/guanine phosphoribosyltransferase-like PRPP-binding protein